VSPDWPRHVVLCRDRLVGVGGAERVLIEQTQALARRGVRCTVVLFELADAFRTALTPDADVVVLGNHRHSDLVFLPKLVKLARVLRARAPDCVIAHQSLGDYLRWALMGTGIPYYLMRYSSPLYQAYDTVKYSTLHRRHLTRVRAGGPAYSGEIPASWQAGPLRRLVNELTAVKDWLGVRGARRVFTLTPQSRWELGQFYGIDAVVWTPGLTQAARPARYDEPAVRSLRERYGIRADERVILSVNRLEYRKRIHVLIDAFRLLRGQGASARLLVVGEGEQRRALEQQVRDAGLTGQVVFAGLVSEASLPHHYQVCDVAVAILWGSWALSVVEPLLYNKPLLISDEIPDLLPGVPNLFRVAPEPVAVARGLRRALVSAPLDSADVIRHQLDWDRQIDQFLAQLRADPAASRYH
jgi:glycosyltransferase involved in cell wall biosynthesis